MPKKKVVNERCLDIDDLNDDSSNDRVVKISVSDSGTVSYLDDKPYGFS